MGTLLLVLSASDSHFGPRVLWPLWVLTILAALFVTQFKKRNRCALGARLMVLSAFFASFGGAVPQTVLHPPYPQIVFSAFALAPLAMIAILPALVPIVMVVGVAVIATTTALQTDIFVTCIHTLHGYTVLWIALSVGALLLWEEWPATGLWSRRPKSVAQ